MSLSWSSCAVFTRMRLTSSATFPTPTTATPLAFRTISRAAASGWPLYHATNSVALMLPVRSSPGMPRRRSLLAPTVYSTAS